MPRLTPYLLLPLLASSLAPIVADPTPAADPASGFHFVGYQEDTLVGSSAEIVYLPPGVTDKEDDKRIVVVEIPAPTKKLTALERANIIADKMQTMAENEKDFFSRLAKGTVNRQTVITLNDGPADNYLITVDPASAKAWQKLFGMGDDSAVAYLLKTFKDRLAGKLRDAKFDFQLTTPEERIERANDYRRQALEARRKKEDTRVAALLQRGIGLAPADANLYAMLATFYLEKNDTAHAQQIVAQAKQNSVDLPDLIRTLDPEGNNPLVKLVAQAGN